MRFSLECRKKLNGAKLYVRIFQISSLLASVYFLAVPGYMAVILKRGVITYLFDLGMSAIPRYEALGLSFLYRLTLSEILVFFVMLSIALTVGVVSDKLLERDEKTSKILHYIFIVLLTADLIFRALPFGFNTSFGLVVAVLSFVLRLACLALVTADLIADKRNKSKKEE